MLPTRLLDTETAPLTCDYRSYRIVSAAPPSSGGATLCEILNILQGYDLRSLGFHSARSVHVMVDTGMGRFGSRLDDAELIVRQVLTAPALRLVGIASHYPQADDVGFSLGQEAALAALLARLPALPADCWIHYANSEGVMLRPAGPANTVRVGLLLTGVVPDGCPNPGVITALRWVSSLSLAKHLPAGHSISYNRTRVLDRDTLVGIVPVGYADGYPIALSNRGAVLVQGRRCPVLGRVTMDYCVVDLTDLPQTPVPGEGVVLFGKQGDETITVTELARLAGTIPYDILCGLRGRCDGVLPRVDSGGYDADGTARIHLEHQLAVVFGDGDDVMKVAQRVALVTIHFGGFDFVGLPLDEIRFGGRHAPP